MKLWKVIAATSVLVLSGAAAQAAVYNVDPLRCTLTLANSGDANELNAIANCMNTTNGTSLTGSDLVLDTALKGSQQTIQTDANDSFFVDLGTDRMGFFMLKFGNNSSGFRNYIFENLAEYSKLVWTNDQIGDIMVTTDCFQTGGDCKLSHISFATDPSAQVPLPATGLLLLGGIGGLAALRKRKAA